jgi:hypothetical protein
LIAEDDENERDDDKNYENPYKCKKYYPVHYEKF